MEKQNFHITGLEGASDAYAAQIKELKSENHKKALQVEQLVGDVVERDRHIAALETEVDEQCATIADLDLGDNSTQVSSHDASEAPKAISTVTVPQKVKVKANVVDSRQQAMRLEPFNESGSGTAITTLETSALTAEATAGPAANLSIFPIFATASTVKQTIPPPPAPKLRMAVDLAKFAKKSTTKPIGSTKKTDTTLSNARKDGPAPTIDTSSDIRTKSLEERKLFANGPKVQVKMGEIALATVPKYALMQCSAKAFKHFSENTESTSFDLPAGSMNATAATAHLEWMREMTFQHRVYSVTLHSDEKFDDKNLQICRASRVLGLNHMYVGHFTKIFCDRIRSNTVSNSLLFKIAAAAYPENDPIYDCLANNLANLRLHGNLQNQAAIKALLQHSEDLKARVEKIEERMRKKHNEARPARGPKVVDVCHKMNV